MKVKMITALTTDKLNLSFGEVVLVDKIFGKQLIDSNMAVLVEEPKAPKKEKIVEEPIVEPNKEEAPVKRGRKKKLVVK